MNQYEISNILKPLVNKFYFHVELIEHDGKTMPRFWNGNEWQYVGIDENKISLGYIRNTDDIELVKVDIGGCGTDYATKNSYRCVFYIRCFDSNKSNFITEVLRLLNGKNIVVKKVVTDSNRLLRSETDFNKKIVITNQLLYIAFDIEVTTESNFCCDEIICEPKKINCL